MLKKYIFGLFVALSVPMLVAYAAPTLSVNGSSDGTNTGSVSVSGGDINAPVVMYYTDANGALQSRTIGNTDASGAFTSGINTNSFSFNPAYPVYVMVNGMQTGSMMWPNSTTTSSQLMFGAVNPTFTTGQNGTVSVLGAGGSYYVASNSNPNVSASISNGTLTVNGNQPGNAQIMICAYSNGTCKNLSVTIAGSSVAGNPTLSQSSLNLSQGGSGTITLSGGTGPYAVNVVSGTGVSTVLTGNTLTVNGLASGTNTINVCSANTTSLNTYNSMCTPLTVTVNGGGSTSVNTSTNTNTTSSPIGFTLALPYATAAKLMLNGSNAGYFLQSQSSTPVAASVSGNTLTMNGTALGSGTVTVCATGTTTCYPINIVVEQSTALTGTGGGYLFDVNLGIGSTGMDVTELQKRLKAEGYFLAEPTGYYGPITAQAVMQYQTAHGISAVGVVGPQTRAMLNQ